MRRIIVSEFISVDGVIHAPNEWHFPFWSDEMGAYKRDELFACDALLLGRVTYDGFAAAWPTAEGTGDFGERMNHLPKYVVSATLKTTDWNNSHIIRGNVMDEVARLTREPGQDILIGGSAALTQSLMEHDLVDEFRLMVHPVVVGKGKRLFGEAGVSKTFALAETQPLPNGVIVLTYHRAPASGTEGADGAATATA